MRDVNFLSVFRCTKVASFLSNLININPRFKAIVDPCPLKETLMKRPSVAVIAIVSASIMKKAES